MVFVMLLLILLLIFFLDGFDEITFAVADAVVDKFVTVNAVVYR